jgi:hypothetical protein
MISAVAEGRKDTEFANLNIKLAAYLGGVSRRE